MRKHGGIFCIFNFINIDTVMFCIIDNSSILTVYNTIYKTIIISIYEVQHCTRLLCSTLYAFREGLLRKLLMAILLYIWNKKSVIIITVFRNYAVVVTTSTVLIFKPYNVYVWEGQIVNTECDSEYGER